ncbi:MAG: glycine cleavage system protein GcvH [Gemmatimonadetes bacterium]|nr:glycine cleavage system protein GcvH [Gemmatimonadota bacterium]
MSNVPDKFRYSEDHEWVAFDGESGIATIGITDYAQGELGDVVFLELPEVGATVAKGDSAGTIEAVKTVADLLAPFSGEITEVNAVLDDRPELVNTDPYGEGWMIRLRVDDRSAVEGLLDADAYQQHIG